MTERYTGRIYRIINDVDDTAYIGSTTQKLCVRMGAHRRYARKGSKQPMYEHMRRVGVEHFKILLLHHIDNCTKEQLKALEHEFITGVNIIKLRKEQTCEHGRRRTQCVQCGGSEICEHKRQRHNCIKCKGSQICEHNQQRLSCKTCSPYSCGACKQVYAGKSSYTRHCKSKKHLKNLEK